MAEVVCLFQDYLSDLSTRDKIAILAEAETEVVGHVEAEEDRRQSYGRLPREGYRQLVEELRRVFARNAPLALSALIVAPPDTPAARRLSAESQEAMYVIREL